MDDALRRSLFIPDARGMPHPRTLRLVHFVAYLVLVPGVAYTRTTP